MDAARGSLNRGALPKALKGRHERGPVLEGLWHSNPPSGIETDSDRMRRFSRSEERKINAVDVARKCILNVHLQTAIYVYMKIRNEGINFIQEGRYAYSSSLAIDSPFI